MNVTYGQINMYTKIDESKINIAPLKLEYKILYVFRQVHGAVDHHRIQYNLERKFTNTDRKCIWIKISRK